MLAHDRDLGLLRERILQPVGQPIRIGVSQHDDRGRRLGLLLGGSGRMRKIGPTLAAVPASSSATVAVALAGKTAEEVPERIGAVALRAAPVPELRLHRRHQHQAEADARQRRQAFVIAPKSHYRRQLICASGLPATDGQHHHENVKLKMLDWLTAPSPCGLRGTLLYMVILVKFYQPADFRRRMPPRISFAGTV